MRRISLFGIAVCVSVVGLLVTIIPSAGADGTETLGPPSIPISAGTGVAVAGVGLFTQPGTMNVAVPAGATIKQVLVYWEGQHFETAEPDTQIVVTNVETGTDTPVNGTVIGGPSFAWTHHKKGVATKVLGTTVRADATTLDLVRPGDNTLEVSGLNMLPRNNGAGVFVIYDTGGAPAGIALRDGWDRASITNPIGHPGRVMVPQTFTVPSSTSSRTVQLALSIASIEHRPHRVLVTVGTKTTAFTNLFYDTDGPEWSTIVLPIEVPAGQTQVTVTMEPFNDPTPAKPASIDWIYAALIDPPRCQQASDTDKTAVARAYGVSLDLFGNPIIPPTPDSNDQSPQSIIDENIGGAVGVKLLAVDEDERIGAAGASSSATATTAEVSVTVPNVSITSSSVVARSVSTATGSTASSSGEGSHIEDLIINGTLIGDVSEPLVVEVPGQVPGQPVARVHLLEEIASGAAAGVTQPEGVSATQAGVFRSGLRVIGIRVELLNGTDAASELVVASAESRASFPASPTCLLGPAVRGDAYLVSVDNIQPKARAVAGQVTLGSTGGDEDRHVLDLTPLGLVAGETSTEGTLSPLQVYSHAFAGEVVLKGPDGSPVVTAKVIEAKSQTIGTAPSGDSGETTIADLKIGGTDVCATLTLGSTCKPAKNEVLLIKGSEVLVLLNEQFTDTNDGRFVVNAVHIFVIGQGNPFGLPVGAEIILSHASSGTTPA